MLPRIAVDAMGGDFAPREIVKGAIKAVGSIPVQIVLVGDEVEIKKIFGREKLDRISIVHASQVIGMDEPPASAVKNKKDSSINVAMKFVKEGKADGVVSAGNTGALMASALFNLGRISGVERPAIATIFPIPQGEILLLDMGANVDSKPKHLKQFAEMGSLYAEHVMHIKNPRVGLLNIGEEIEKGNELTISAYPLLKEAKINFIGNVESKEILSGKVDVIVCDGFIGNLILKFAESVSETVLKLLKEEISKNPISKLGVLMVLPALTNLKKTIDYEEHGGAPLLGIAGVCFKAHGRAKEKAIMNAIRVAAESVEKDIVGCISKVEAE